MRMMLIFSMTDVDVWVEVCQKVYFPIDGYSTADFITLHAVLSAIIRYSSEPEFCELRLSRLEAQETIRLCHKNVKAALEQSNFFLQPCADNIAALLHGVSQRKGNYR